jgi:hypothetical protein
MCDKYNTINIDGFNVILLESNIIVIENIITEEKCNEYIQLLNESELEKKVIESYNNVECYELNLSKFREMNKYKICDQEIYTIVNNSFGIFSKLRPHVKIVNDNGYSLRKIYGKTREHIDFLNHPSDTRTLSAIFLLNDDYEGGIFNFKYQNIYHKVKKGSVIMFPPYWTHPHSVSEVKNGQFRYTINTWGNFI